MQILKRVLSIFITLTLTSSIAGCSQSSSSLQSSNPDTSSAPPVHTAFTEEDALTASEVVYMHLINGTFDEITELLDDTVKSTLPDGAFEAGYQSEIVPTGTFETIADKTVTKSNDTYIVVLVAQHTDGQPRLTCVFSPEGKITGIGIANPGAVVEMADPLPLALPEGAQERKVTLHAGTEKELTGALVLPKGVDSSTPVVVMAQGSGVSDLDETIGANKPFRDIAYGLAEHGIASIRYDKLHYAHPELATVDLTIDDEYTITVLEALAVMRTEAELGNAYMLGHSQGGMLTPYLMNESNGGFHGGIILAGTPRQLWELMYDQNIAMLEGASEAQLTTVTAQLNAEKEKIMTLNAMSDEELRSTTVFSMPGPYIAHLNRINTLALAYENNLPLLILQGEEDFQVYFDVDFPAWKDGLKDMGDLVTYKSYPNLSHLFMPASGSIKDALQAYDTPELVDESVIADIAQWISAQE